MGRFTPPESKAPIRGRVKVRVRGRDMIRIRIWVRGRVMVRVEIGCVTPPNESKALFRVSLG